MTALVARDDSGKARIHLAGTGGLLLDVEDGHIDTLAQRRLWSLANLLRAGRAVAHIHELVPGINNLLVLFDPAAVAPDRMAQQLLACWADATPAREGTRVVEVAVDYGGEMGEDLEDLAGRADLDVPAYVRIHSEAEYFVACLGSMPGFAYMAGLPRRLAVPRRSVPRLKLPQGAVIVGGAQASVFPTTGPCGWHVLGRADLQLFDARRTPPCPLAPGDQVRFTVRSVQPLLRKAA